MKYSNVFFKGFILLLFLMSFGCQKSSSDDFASGKDPWNKPDVEGTPLQGFINGRAWKFTQGKATTLKHRGKDILVISLWSGNYRDPCEEVRGSDFQARIQVVSEVDSWDIDNQDPFKNYPLLIFSDLTSEIQAHHNLVASAGQIQITKIQKDLVVGKVQGSFSGSPGGKTEILGAFAVPFCGSR